MPPCSIYQWVPGFVLVNVAPDRIFELFYSSLRKKLLVESTSRIRTSTDPAHPSLFRITHRHPRSNTKIASFGKVFYFAPRVSSFKIIMM